jgi:hypothetical protein
VEGEIWNHPIRKEDLKEELFLLTTKLDVCGVKEVIEDHGL